MISIDNEQLARVRAAISSEGMASRLYTALARRERSYTAEPGIVTAADSMDWWHVVWERMSDVAFMQRIEPSDERAEWLRTETLAICDRPLDDWIGPFFRERTSPPAGMLETAHVGLAVASAAALCPEVFSDAERDRIAAALKEKCQILCERALTQRVATLERAPDAPQNRGRLNNWFIVLLNGYGTVSAYLRDDAALNRAAEFYALATKIYNADSYGESLQYWNYATIHLAHLNEVMQAARPDLAAELDRSCYTRCVTWVVQSHLYNKPLAGWGERSYPRALNFGDSTAMFRPTADVVLHIAARCKELHPTEAGLARWLFEQTFAEIELEPTDRDSFGFFNHFRWPALVSLPEAAPPLSPDDAKLPLTQAFECGSVIIRDSRAENATTLGVQAGYRPLRVVGHRHLDQNSFILAHRRERIFVDPGHCCYRLAAQRASGGPAGPPTWTVYNQTGAGLGQRPAAGRVAAPPPPINRLVRLEDLDGVSIITSDAADAYGAPVTRAERTWIALLPHVVFLVDRIEAEEPLEIRSHFVFNNRDNRLSINAPTPTRLVLRRGDAAAKFFQLQSRGDDGADVSTRVERSWGYVHDVYHPQPNQPGQGREGSADIRTFTTPPVRNYLAIYSIVLDAEPAIRGWHVQPEESGRFRVSSPDSNGPALAVRADGSLELVDEERGRTLTIDAGAGRVTT
jgi:hypothetical protein